MQTKEISFFKKIIMSIKDFEKYPEMASKSLTSVLKYIMQLVAILTIVALSMYIYNISKEITKSIETLKNDVPEFVLEQGTLKMDTEEEKIIENDDALLNIIIIDTKDISQEKEEEYISNLKSNKTGVAFLKDKLIVNAGGSATIAYSYKDLIDSSIKIDKQTLINNFSNTNLSMVYIGIFIMLFIYLYVAYLISTLLDSLILALLGYITALIMRIRMRFTAMVKIAIHALTLPIILNLIYIIIQNFTGFEIKYFEVMYIAVAYIYIITAILMIKSDLIKRGQELAKILEQEEKVKKELEKQEREEKKEEKKEEKEKEKEEKKEDRSSGEEPQGENA